MKEFILYLYSSLTGRTLQIIYFIEGADWDAVQKKFQLFSDRSSSNSDMLITVSEAEISILESYDTHIRYKGSPMVINNEMVTQICKDALGLKVVMNFDRALVSRLITNLFIFLSSLFSLILIFETCSNVYSNRGADVSNLLVPTLVCYLGLVFNWLLSRTKLVETKRAINNVVES